MKYLIMLLMAICLATPGQSGERTDKVVDGLLKLGGKAIQRQLDKRAEKRADQEQEADQQKSGEAGAAEDSAAEEGSEEKRTWRDRGGEMLSTFLTGSADGLGEKPLTQWLSAALKQTLDILLDEYKDQYKDEGRKYAREVGDIVVDRVREDPKISSSITTVKALCWAVIVYLSLVTLVMLAALLHLKKVNTRLFAAVEELKKATSKSDA